MVVPTYNEASNLPALIARLRRAVPEVDVLIVDDDSPDGTGRLADGLARLDPQVSVLHRSVKEGLGAAYLHGFAVALERGYDVIGEMDADRSHQPEQLPALLEALDSADLVLGSRWVPGGRVVDWSRSRLLLSRGGNWYARLLLGLPVRDGTGGFRVFRRAALESIALDEVDSVGYCFQVELVYRAHRAGMRITEVPIEFTDRTEGESKMTVDVAVESFSRITRWGVARWLRRAPAGREKSLDVR